MSIFLKYIKTNVVVVIQTWIYFCI